MSLVFEAVYIGIFVYAFMKQGGENMEIEEKITYSVEKTRDSIKTKRIDEKSDGNLTSSTILQSKDEVVINP